MCMCICVCVGLHLFITEQLLEVGKSRLWCTVAVLGHLWGEGDLCWKEYVSLVYHLSRVGCELIDFVIFSGTSSI